VRFNRAPVYFVGCYEQIEHLRLPSVNRFIRQYLKRFIPA